MENKNKKTLNFFSALFFLILVATLIAVAPQKASAQTIEIPENWYEFKGYNDWYNYSIRFPNTWKVHAYSDEFHALGPQNTDKYQFYIKEFEEKTIEQAKKSYETTNVKVQSENDQIISGLDDVLAQIVTYKNSQTNKEFKLTFINRGSLTISLTTPTASDGSNLHNIYKSFYFTDSFKRYINTEQALSFIVPKNFTIRATDYEIVVIDQLHNQRQIFKINLQTKKPTFAPSKNITASALHTTAEDYYEKYIMEMYKSFQEFRSSQDYTPYIYFQDVRQNHPNVEAVNTLASLRLISTRNNKFHPDSPITKAEFMKLAISTRHKPDSKKYKNCFDDVQTEWFARYICYAAEISIIKDENKQFYPHDNISRAEAIKIITELVYEDVESQKKTDQLPDDILEDDWYYNYYVFADNKNILDKQHLQDNKYLPNDAITRKEVVQMLYKSFPVAFR